MHRRVAAIVFGAMLTLSACGSATTTIDSAGPVAASPDAPAVEPSDSTTNPPEESTTRPPTTVAPPNTEAPVTTTTAEPASVGSSTAETTEVPVVDADLVDLVGGGQLDLNSIVGQDTVLWFWAPW